MSQYVTKIRTESGDLQIDYNALANLPKSDDSLSISGSFADAKAVGDKIIELDDSVVKSINGVNINEDGSITLTPSDVGAVNKAGDTMTGTLTAPLLYLQGDKTSEYRYINIYKHGVDNYVGRIMYNLADDSRRFHIVAVPADQDNKSEIAYERYLFPVPSSGLEKSVSYNVLTSKTPVTIEQGGTGASTVAGVRNTLGLGNTTGAVPVANGGTGSTTAADARKNLGAADASHTHSDYVKKTNFSLKDTTLYITTT